MTRLVTIDPREITVTPVFKMLEVENIPKSETAGHAVMEVKEVVEVRFAGSKNYSPIFPVSAMYKREGNQTITYAERWPDQYRAFKEGNPQEASGTPLEMLRPFGVTPEQLSLCRVLKVYSIEALSHLEGPALKSLGMNANSLKEMARAFLADRNSGLGAMQEIEALKAEIAAMKAAHLPEQEATGAEIAAALDAADAAYAALSDDDLKVEISNITGKRPAGNPSRKTMIHALEELKAA